MSPTFTVQLSFWEVKVEFHFHFPQHKTNTAFSLVSRSKPTYEELFEMVVGTLKQSKPELLSYQHLRHLLPKGDFNKYLHGFTINVDEIYDEVTDSNGLGKRLTCRDGGYRVWYPAEASSKMNSFLDLSKIGG
jgi:hypothetical protein